jgi:TPR repeat protein
MASIAFVAAAVADEDGAARIAQREMSGSDLSYEAYIDSDSRFKCLYGYVADKTGDHAAAIAIFEDCIRRWNDVYSMIWLSLILDTGVGRPRDAARATELLRRGAQIHDEAGYGSLARYHYGVALYEGRGTAADRDAAVQWLRQAAAEGVGEAADYLAGKHVDARP